jgi:hypothetical protein
MQSRLVCSSAVAVELLRRLSLASIRRASISAEERFCLSSCRGEFRVFMWITFNGIGCTLSR